MYESMWRKQISVSFKLYSFIKKSTYKVVQILLKSSQEVVDYIL
jgi:hypothetical protein